MATAAPEATEAAAPKKSKKLLIIVGAVVLVLLLGGGGAFWYISKQRAAAAAEDGEEPAKAAAHDAHPVPPAYLPMDNMVVNLADVGGDRVAQIGVTLVVTDAHASDQVKAFLPTIRSGVLLLISQKTAVELLTPEGKTKLAKEILHQALIPFGGGDEEEAAPEDGKKKKKAAAPHADLPVTGVLFSSFIVQ
ncbi:flagellar basal body-associated FliL family protein [Rhodoferax sp. GW822-FHT02A01]|uniref:flagellar basal body-associated FliL family protein n=1 Tax=Rhodoferax sp. GW822-FHT02A01 TaxID=3141537 RepID=UPI00315CA993